MYRIYVWHRGQEIRNFFVEAGDSFQETMAYARAWAAENCPGAEVRSTIVICK